MDDKSKHQILELNKDKRRALIKWMRCQMVNAALNPACIFCAIPLVRPENVICKDCARGPKIAASRARESAVVHEEVIEQIKTLAGWLEGLSQEEFLQFVQREQLAKMSIDPNKEIN